MRDLDYKRIMKTIQREGGYVNHPDDPGGETKYGISKKSYPKLNIKLLTLQDAVNIYYRDFYTQCGCQLIGDDEIAWKLFDLGVNCGPVIAGRLLQQGYNRLSSSPLAVDGIVGPGTAKAVNNYKWKKALYCAFKNCAFERYMEIVQRKPSQRKFLDGWLNRLEEA